MILLKSQLNLFEISFLKTCALLSGYLDRIKFLLFNTLLTLELTPNADSLADSLMIFLNLPIFDFPGL